MRCARISANAGAAASHLSHFSENPILLLQSSGSMIFEQQGNKIAVASGDVFIFNPAEHWILRQERRAIFFALEVRPGQLAEVCPDWAKHVPSSFPRGSSAMIMALVQAAFEQVAAMTNEGAVAFDTALMSLIGAALCDGADALKPSVIPSAVRGIQNELLSKLNDIDFSPKVLARRHGLSERQLYRLFEKAGTSLRRWVRQTRLDRCAADLRNPHLRERSITQIAFGYGFNDAAHFSRTFRAEFGQTPSYYRAAAIETAVAS
jgi:AraC-like DNA-binding protein